jgi:hypothetical protein
VRDAVLARAARLSEAARRVLDVVALVPARAELWLLEHAAAANFPHLDECVEVGILRSVGPAVEFHHHWPAINRLSDNNQAERRHLARKMAIFTLSWS